MALSEFFNITDERANSEKILHIKGQPPKKRIFIPPTLVLKKILYTMRDDLLEGSLMVFAHNGIFSPIAQMDAFPTSMSFRLTHYTKTARSLILCFYGIG